MVISMNLFRKLLAITTLAITLLALSTPALSQTAGMPNISPTPEAGTISNAGLITVEQSHRDIMTILMGMNETNTAKSMIVTGGVDRVLSRGTHTVFVPGETAIRELDADREQISALTNDMQTANQTMQGLITDGMVMPADMARGKTITMLNGKTLSASSKDGTLMLDGARITRAIQATNGMIYVIDSMPGR